MYFSALTVLVGLASLAVVSASAPKDTEQALHNATSDAWSNLPLNSSIPVERIRLTFSPNKVRRMHESLEHVKVNLDTVDSEQQHWFSLASDSWSEINGPTLEDEINRHPQFNASVTVDGQTSYLHFMALFSKQPDAVPIVFLHGWPGSFLDYLDLLDVVRSKYTPEDCPFHLIVPSLPGYAFSSGSPMGRYTNLTAVARTVDTLLTGIGLENGFIAQGGGIGSYIARFLGSYSPNCEAVHVNFLPIVHGLPDPSNDTDLSQQDLDVLNRSSYFQFKYPKETAVADHTGQATLGAIAEKSPLSLLAWLGDKLNDWVDPQSPFPMRTTLTHASVYYLTKMMTSEYSQLSSLVVPEEVAPFVPKPFGYSRFPFDISGVPRKWAATLGDLVWFTAHDRGGHFAAIERPEELWNDVEHFVRTAFPDDLL
ncbi:hypothetical protein BBP40_006583 [Aspergillus hancockii]|nr:hypothetical protein BBP40_006583 [Aspergillus hancockii]